MVLPPPVTPRTLPLASVIALHAGPDPAEQRGSAFAVPGSAQAGTERARVGGFLPLLAVSRAEFKDPD